jgi:hypothetical protein
MSGPVECHVVYMYRVLICHVASYPIILVSLRKLALEKPTKNRKTLLHISVILHLVCDSCTIVQMKSQR